MADNSENINAILTKKNEAEKVLFDAEQKKVTAYDDYIKYKYHKQQAEEDYQLAVLQKQEADQNYELFTNQKTIDTVYLQLHCTVEGCSNVFVKCERSDAEEFLANSEFLYEFVEINTLNGGDPELPLTKVNFELYHGVINNQHCENYCDRCLIIEPVLQMYSPFFSGQNRTWKCHYDYSWDKKPHEHKCQISQDGNLFYYKKTDLFESTMLYCLLSLIRKIVDSSVEPMITDKNGNILTKSDRVTKIILSVDNNIEFSIDLPGDAKCEISHRSWEKRPSVWFQAIEQNNVEWIKTINLLVEMFEMLSDMDSNNLILLFQ